MGRSSQGTSSVTERELELRPYQWLQARKCGWVKATATVIAANCPLWLQANPERLAMPVLSGVTDRMLLKIAGRPTGHLCLQLGVTSLCKDSSGEDRTSGALRSTQNGVLGGGGGTSLETSRASSGTTMGGCNCVNQPL